MYCWSSLDKELKLKVLCQNSWLAFNLTAGYDDGRCTAVRFNESQMHRVETCWWLRLLGPAPAAYGVVGWVGERTEYSKVRSKNMVTDSRLA